MLVKDYMTRHPLLAEPTMTVVEAQRFMGENDIRHLPVAGSGKRLLGLVTRGRLLVDPGRLSSLDVWDIARTLAGLTVSDVMVKSDDVISVDQNLTIEEAATLMIQKKIGCLPVLEEGIVVGIITETDLLAQLATMMVTDQECVRATVRILERKGELARLVEAISAQGWGILTLGGVPAPKDPGRWEAVVKFRYVTKDQVRDVLESFGDAQIRDIRDM